MTKYYYDDPLAAAWMAKHFGMTFEGWGGGIPADIEDLGRIFVDDVSAEIIQPKINDLVEIRYGHRFAVSTVTAVLDEEDEDFEASFETDDTHWSSHSDLVRIIQRNGIAFHWPEAEA